MSPRIDSEFEENLQYQKGVISETYQRPDKSYFQEMKESKNMVNTDRLVQTFLLKQADIDKILKNNSTKCTQRYPFASHSKRNTGRISIQLLLQRHISLPSSKYVAQ